MPNNEISVVTITYKHFRFLETARDYPLMKDALGKNRPTAEYKELLRRVSRAAFGQDSDHLDFIGYLNTHRSFEYEELWDKIDELIRDYIAFTANEITEKED